MKYKQLSKFGQSKTHPPSSTKLPTYAPETEEVNSFTSPQTGAILKKSATQMTPAEVLHLQRTIGNRAVMRKLGRQSPTTIQRWRHNIFSGAYVRQWGMGNEENEDKLDERKKVLFRIIRLLRQIEYFEEQKTTGRQHGDYLKQKLLPPLRELRSECYNYLNLAAKEDSKLFSFGSSPYKEVAEIKSIIEHASRDIDLISTIPPDTARIFFREGFTWRQVIMNYINEPPQ